MNQYDVYKRCSIYYDYDMICYAKFDMICYYKIEYDMA